LFFCPASSDANAVFGFCQGASNVIPVIVHRLFNAAQAREPVVDLFWGMIAATATD
jgi:dihydrodipicolinate synthase/N-acetylneuraminate lyase